MGNFILGAIVAVLGLAYVGGWDRGMKRLVTSSRCIRSRTWTSSTVSRTRVCA